MAKETKPTETKPDSTESMTKPSVVRPVPLGNVITHSLNNGRMSTPESETDKKG